MPPPTSNLCKTLIIIVDKQTVSVNISSLGHFAHLLKLCFGVVEVRALHNLRELGIQTHTEIKHAAVNLNLEGRRKMI